MKFNTTAMTSSSLEQFRALVMAQEALADSLSQAVDADRFVDLAMRSASAHGIALGAEAVRAEIRPDPLGLARWAAAPVTGALWPPKQWLPIQVTALNGPLYVDWAHFGTRPLTEPFFEDSIRRSLSRPFNRMFRYRMTLGDFLDDFLDHAAGQQSLAPSGFIFHMSRCGSTLVAQMLAALPQNIVISEAAPIDAVVQFSRAWPDLAADRHCQHLIAMLAAFGRRRSGSERNYFIKLDSWHTLALPLFRRAFPSVPWVFLYRDPVEVLVSQMRQRGTQMVSEIVSPSLYGIDDADGMRSDEYCARVLNKICSAVVENDGAGGGLLINYRELPDAIWTKILPHLGVACSERERAAMRLAARQDAKAPSFEFANDSEAKQRDATELIRTLAERHLGEVYRQLEELRAGGKPR
jgi:hypothetical protein